MLVIADPVYSGNDPRVHAQDSRTPPDFAYRQLCRGISCDSLPRLESTTQFARNLCSLFKIKIDTLIGLQADEFNVKTAPLSRYGVGVVFATHGELKGIAPFLRQPSLLLTNPGLISDNPELNDEFFTAQEIADLTIPTEIVFALACQTGNGALRTGEGVTSLGTAFQMAGAKSVVVSLWSVNDYVSNIFGLELIKRIIRGEPKDNALLAVRRELINKGFKHPYYWAPYILVGERNALPLTMRPEFDRWVILFCIVGGILLTALILLIWKRLKR